MSNRKEELAKLETEIEQGYRSRPRTFPNFLKKPILHFKLYKDLRYFGMSRKRALNMIYKNSV